MEKKDEDSGVKLTLVFVRSAHVSERGVQPLGLVRSVQVARKVGGLIKGQGADNSSLVKIFRPTGLVFEDSTNTYDTARRISTALGKALHGDVDVKPQHFLMENTGSPFIKELPREVDAGTRFAVMVASSEVIDDNLSLLLGKAGDLNASSSSKALVQNLKRGGALVVDINVSRDFMVKVAAEGVKSVAPDGVEAQSVELSQFNYLVEAIKGKGTFEEQGVSMVAYTL